VVNDLPDLINDLNVELPLLAEGGRLELRSTEDIIVAAPVDFLREQFLVLLLVAVLEVGLVGQVVHFHIEVANEVFEVSLELVQQVQFFLQLYLLVLEPPLLSRFDLVVLGLQYGSSLLNSLQEGIAELIDLIFDVYLVLVEVELALDGAFKPHL